MIEPIRALVLSGELDPAALEDADGVGRARFHFDVSHGYVDQLGQDSLANHIFGARCEKFASIATGLRWSGRELGAFKKVPDLWPDVEVKGTRGWDADLLVKLRDQPGGRYLLVHCAQSVFTLVGWLPGETCHSARFAVEEGSIGWRVPAAYLWSLAPAVAA